jgi:mono/diheme cytochrome c family protein
MNRPFALLLAMIASGSLAAAAPEPATNNKTGLEFFERKIRPGLSEHCDSCHSAEAAATGKLRRNANAAAASHGMT